MKGTEAWDDGNTSNGDGWSRNQMWRRIHQDCYITLRIVLNYVSQYFNKLAALHKKITHLLQLFVHCKQLKKYWKW